MKKIATLLVLMLCLPIIGFGAQIFGSLRADNASVGEGVTVKIQCDKDTYEAKTNVYGSYRVPLRLSKKCQLFVDYRGQLSKPFDVYPYEDPVRYDFDLVKENDGSLVLRRR